LFPPSPNRPSNFYPATYIIKAPSFATGALPTLRNQAAAYYTHRKLYINDSGSELTVDKPIPLGEAQTNATIHGMSGGPTVIKDDVDRMPEERLSLLKKILPRSREAAFPVDLFESVAPDYPKVFLRRVEKNWGSFAVVAVYNVTEEPLRLPLQLSRLGLDADADYVAWEFWNEEYVGRVRESFCAQVPPRAVKVYRFVRDIGLPVLLGTDMHVLMGEVEVDDCSWDAAERTLSGRALRPSGERGNVFLHMPPDLRVAQPKGLWIAKDLQEDCCIIRVSLDFEEGAADWAVRFTDRFG
jgi:hypothetical protein